MDLFHPDGVVILVDKPLEWTSFDVVKKIKYAGGFKKVGHAGTLDPLATGLLVICIGKKTKTIESIQAQAKEYIGEFYLGATRPSCDRETEIDNRYPTDHINEELIQQTLESFKGQIEQTPPIFSAIKVKGERAYKAAREGRKLEIKSRLVTINHFEVESSEMPLIKFKIGCSKGTYIRSIARDLGEKLNSGAYLHSLRRTKIGAFDVEKAYSIDQLTELIKSQRESLS